MKKIISFALVLVLVLGLMAGIGGSAFAAGENKILYHVHNSLPYVTLDPSIEYSNGIMILQNVYETLTHYNPETADVEPMLATSWTSNEDGTVWVFQIRDDVTFHDGSKLTAQQVVNSIQRSMDLGQGGAYIWDAVLADNGGSLAATGEYEVTITCGYPSAIDLIASSAYAAYIMSDSVIDKDTEYFNQGNDGGSGPYMISQANGDSVVLQAYPDYRGGWSDEQYQYVYVREVSESSARRQMLETGEAQIACEFSATDLEALEAQPDKVYSMKAETFNNVIMFINTEVEPGNNADFRRALAYAFPYEQTVNDVMNGNAAQSVGTVPAGLWGHSDDVFQYTLDMDKAKEYLEKSGVNTDGLKLTVTYMTGDDTYASALQLYQVNLRKLGIELELKSMEWDQQWAQAQNTDPASRQNMFLFIWWPDYADPVSWFTSLLHSEDEIVYNLSYLHDDELDALIDEAVALTVTDREAAEANYVKVQEIVADQAYYLNLYDQVHTYIISNGVEGVAENPAYSYTIDYYQVTSK
ncbi:MAG: ABC transporter substrate-binding protein [Oscillospiraceae bacterium]|nr:ABC transporter substrate-binding protein [Oscillospiraceae bacterium]